MTAQLGSEGRPLRVAVVGSGPSGFYAAEALFSAEPTVEVDLYDELPTPYGLVRYGVAPDHAKIKKIIKVYERTAENENFGFLGNVSVGKDITIEELRAYYDAVIFASGAQTDRRLGIPGEDLPGSYTATEFVAWYNGHPDYQDREFDLSHEVAMIIGQGNVAIDVCRILAKPVSAHKSQRSRPSLHRGRFKPVRPLRTWRCKGMVSSSWKVRLANHSTLELVSSRRIHKVNW